jgi:hypothetical protein
MWPFTIKKRKPVPAEVILEVQDAKDEIGQDLRSIFLDAAKQAAEERAKLEADLLSSGKLQKYLKNTMKYMGEKVHKKDSYGFFLMSARDLDVPLEVWAEYTRIFLKIAAEVKIPASITDGHNDYIRVDREPLLKIITELMPETPPVDLIALRESLRTGSYR